MWDQAGYEVKWTNPNFVPSLWSDAHKMNLWDYTSGAQPGDMIVFDWKNDGELDHVGIVESINGNKITTIEGNSGDELKRNTYDMGDRRLIGVIKPPAQSIAV